MNYGASKFLFDNPVLLAFFVAIILLLVALAEIERHLRRKRAGRSPLKNQSPIVPSIGFAQKADSETCIEAVKRAFQANKKVAGPRYDASDFEHAANLASAIELPFGDSGHSLLWTAEMHGPQYFEELADLMERLNRPDLERIIRKGMDIADRALSPDAEGDSEHPINIKLAADADALEQEFKAINGVDAFEQTIESHLLSAYPWAK